MSQQTLFDLSAYEVGDLLGSHSDDLEDSTIVRKNGKKSKECPTWSMTPDEYGRFRASFAHVTAELIALCPPARAAPTECPIEDDDFDF